MPTLSTGSILSNSINDILAAMATNWPECAESSSPALLRLLRLSNIFHLGVQQLIDEYQLQAADFSVLCTLRRSPAPHCLTPTTLYQSMLFSSGGLTKVLVRLSDLALIERIADPEDKRSRLVQLTKTGKNLIETILPELHQQEQALLAVLSIDEQAQLNNLLQRLLAVHKG